MNARFTALGALLGFILAATVLAPKTAADVEGSKGIFGALSVGQMIEVRQEAVGLVITTYDEPAFKERMIYKITEIERDFIAVDFTDPNGAELEMRYPATSVGVCHMKKSAKPKPTPPAKKKKTLE
jgi:hypothetical protein